MHVWALGLSCETAAAPPDRAARARTRQPENSKRAYLSVPALQTPPKFHEKTPEREERMRFPVGERKKSAKFWAPHPSAPSLRAPNPSGPTFSGFGPPPLRAPKTKLTKCGLAKFGQQKLAKFGQIRMAKCGQLTLAKCGIGQIRFGQMRPNKDGQIRFGQMRHGQTPNPKP